MRDDKSILAEVESLFPPAEAAFVLSLCEWESLPLSARASDRLAEILVIANELLSELEIEEATGLAWLVPHVRRVIDQTDALLQKLAS